MVDPEGLCGKAGREGDDQDWLLRVSRRQSKVF
jgi:hypothetical protein